jgi:hypothetical protein
VWSDSEERRSRRLHVGEGAIYGTKCSVRGHSCVSSIIKRSDAIAVLITVSAERVVFRKV